MHILSRRAQVRNLAEKATALGALPRKLSDRLLLEKVWYSSAHSVSEMTMYECRFDHRDMSLNAARWGPWAMMAG